MTVRKETIVIEVRADGTRIVTRKLGGIDTSARKADKSVRRLAKSSNVLRNSLIGVGSLLTARKILGYADAWTKLNNQLRANLPVTADLAFETARVQRIANETRAPILEVAKLYGQTSAAALELGASQEQVARLTEITGKSLAIAGTSAAAASGSILQLTQLLGGTVVQAQEFNSILDGNRPLLQAVAGGIDRFGGSVSKLREQVRLGGFTVREFVEGALRGGKDIDARFAKTVITVGQATTQLDNAFTAFIGKVNDAEGGTDLLVEGLEDLTGFFNDPANIESAKLLGGAIVTSMTFALEVIRNTVDGVSDLAEEIGRLTHGGNDISTLTDDLTDAGDLLIEITGHASTLGDTFKALAESAIRGFEPAAVTAMDKIITADKRLAFIVENGSMAELQNLAAVSGTELDRLSEAYNSLAGIEGGRAKEQRENLHSLIDVWQKYGREASEALKKVEKASGEGVKDPKKEVPTELGPGTQTGLATGELAKLEKELSKIISKAAPAEGAILELARAEKILASATVASLITKEREGELYALLKKQYEDLIDPMLVLNREIQNQMDLTGLTNDEREIANQMFRTTEQFQKLGIALTEEENEGLREKYQLIQDLTRQQEVLNSIEQPQRDFDDRAGIVGELQGSGAITEGQGALDTVSNAGLLDFEGTETQMTAYVELHRTAFEQIQTLRDEQLVSEQVANQLRMKEDVKLQQQKLANTQKFFGTLAQLSNSENKKLAAVGKAAAITQATIDGILGVQKALASAPPPINFALAAAVGAVAASNVAQIASARRLGGDLDGGQMSRVGEGSRPEMFKSSSTGEQFFIPPERGKVVPLSTPKEARGGTSAEGRGSEGAVEPQAPPIVNVIMDPTDLIAVMSSGAGERQTIETIESNASQIKSILSI